MVNVSYWVLSLFFVLSFSNLVILFFVSAFLVRFRLDLMSFLADSLRVKQHPVSQELVDAKPKTWDEKYEEEVEIVSRRLRQSADGEL